MRLNLTVVLLILLVLFFGNAYARQNGLTPITDIKLNESYGTEASYYNDFRLKSVRSGQIFYHGLADFLGVIPGFIQTGQAVINAVIDVVNTIGGWLADVWDFLRDLVDVEKGGLVYENCL